MIYLELFWIFFKIGLFTIGGGYAMIPMITNEVVNIKQWISAERLIDIIAVAEATPGPFAINAATFIGNSQGGILGGIVATFAVVLPSVIIIIVISIILNKFLNSKLIKGALKGIQPVVAGLILFALFTITVSVAAPGFKPFETAGITIKWIPLVFMATMLVLSFIKTKGKSLHPLILVGISAAGGAILFGLFKL